MHMLGKRRRALWIIYRSQKRTAKSSLQLGGSRCPAIAGIGSLIAMHDPNEWEYIIGYRMTFVTGTNCAWLGGGVNNRQQKLPTISDNAAIIDSLGDLVIGAIAITITQ